MDFIVTFSYVYLMYFNRIYTWLCLSSPFPFLLRLSSLQLVPSTLLFLDQWVRVPYSNVVRGSLKAAFTHGCTTEENDSCPATLNCRVLKGGFCKGSFGKKTWERKRMGLMDIVLVHDSSTPETMSLLKEKGISRLRVAGVPFGPVALGSLVR